MSNKNFNQIIAHKYSLFIGLNFATQKKEKLMAKYQKKRKEPNFIFKFEDGEPTKEECVADMAKVFFLLWEAQKRGLKNA